MSSTRGSRGDGAAGARRLRWFPSTGMAAALACAAAVGLVYAGPLLSGERFYFRDLSQNHGPIIEGARSLLRSGQPLWWNPWAGGGEPLLANPNHLLLSPVGLLALVLPARAGLGLPILAGSMLAAAFLALLLRETGRSFWAATGGALIYALSGYAISLGTLPNVLAAASWIPPALWLIHRARRHRGWLPPAALACAFVLGPCEPASALVLLVFALLPLDGHARDAGPGGAVGAPEPDGASLAGPSAPFGRARGALGSTIAALAFGAGIALCQILPALLWVRASARGADLRLEGLEPGSLHGFGAAGVKWALNVLRLPEMIAPGFLGDPSRLTSWWSASLFATGLPLFLSLHIGAPALLLAVWGSLPAKRAPPRGSATASFARHEPRDRTGTAPEESPEPSSEGSPSPRCGAATSSPGMSGPRRSPAFWARAAVPLAGLGFFALAFGPPLLLLTRVVPAADLFRYPEKLLLGTFLALAWQASRGLDRVLGSSERVRAAPSARALVMAAGLGLVVTLGAAAASAWIVRPAFALPASSPWLAAASRGVRGSFVLAGTEILVFLTALTLLPRLKPRLRGAVCLAGILVPLLVGALTLAAGTLPWRLRANPSATAALFEEPPYFASDLALLRARGERLFRHERPPGFAVRTRSGTLADGFGWERRALGRASASAFGVELAYDRSTDLLDPPGNAAALRFLKQRPLEGQIRFWDLAGVRLILSFHPLEAPALRLAGRLEGESNVPMLLYENQGALPRARTVVVAHFVESDEKAFAALVSESGRWREEVWLQGPTTGPEGLPAPEAGEREALPVGVAEQRMHAPPAGSSGSDGARGAGDPLGSEDPGDGATRETTIVEKGAGRLRIRTGADLRDGRGAGGWLVVSENDVPGWRAKVDGVATPILRANGMHLAVRVPDGSPHEIELHYVPPGFLTGAILSAASLLGACGYAFASTRRSARASPVPLGPGLLR